MRSLSYLLVFITFISIYSCTKIDTTSLGSGIIPDVDGVNTFDTTLDVFAETFALNDDTLKLSYTDEMAVGNINDPLFGNSAGTIFFELKPTFPATTTFQNFRDSLQGYDSTVLCLRYLGGYGDTSTQVTFQVFALRSTLTSPDTLRRPGDTTYPIKANFNTEAIPLGTKPVTLASLTRDSVSVNRSTTLNYKTIRELRIPLSRGPNGMSWANLLRDSLFLSGDSAYRRGFAGFAVKIQQGPAPGSMAYFSLTDTATKLQFYYRRKNGLGANVYDTTSTTFNFNPTNCGYANNVTWDKGVGREIARHLGSNTNGDSLVYVKTNPGTEVRIRIPGLQNLSNRIVHRAELKVLQVPDNAIIDGLLAVPPALYLERVDTNNRNPQKFLSIPYDLNPGESYGSCFPANSGISYSYFGSYPLTEVNNGISNRVYNFNISRYVQQIITKQFANYPLRLTANLYAQHDGCTYTTPFRVTGNSINFGRVRLGGGKGAGNTSPYKMRLRIIYSRI